NLIDVNPRLGDTFRLFVGDNGMDVTRAAYLHFTGQPVPVSRICAGRRWILEDADLVSCIQYYRDGVLTVRKWLGSYLGIKECAWYASDDVLPFLLLCSSLAMRVLRKLVTKTRVLFRSASSSAMQYAAGIG